MCIVVLNVDRIARGLRERMLYVVECIVVLCNVVFSAMLSALQKESCSLYC